MATISRLRASMCTGRLLHSSGTVPAKAVEKSSGSDHSSIRLGEVEVGEA